MAGTISAPTIEDQKRLALLRIESTEWTNCGDVFVQTALLHRFAKDYGLSENVAATKLTVLANVNAERMTQAGTTSFGQSELILVNRFALHTLILDRTVYISDAPFCPYDMPPQVTGLLLIKWMTEPDR